MSKAFPFQFNRIARVEGKTRHLCLIFSIEKPACMNFRDLFFVSKFQKKLFNFFLLMTLEKCYKVKRLFLGLH